MGHVAVSNRVIARNRFGRFIQECEQAGKLTVRDAVDEGVNLSKAMAPVGSKPDPRTTTIVDGMYSRVSGTQGHWGTHARHGLAQEFGAAPHVIPGNPALSFYWEAKGRRWIPAEVFYRTPGLADLVNHPGNAAQPFLRPAYDIVMKRIMDIARRHYPG